MCSSDLMFRRIFLSVFVNETGTAKHGFQLVDFNNELNLVLQAIVAH